MKTEIKKLRQRSDYLRHLADNAEREYVIPSEAEFDDEEEFEHFEPLHQRLRDAATKAMQAARALEEAEELLEYADELNLGVMADARKADWYDDAYVGFCDSMAA